MAGSGSGLRSGLALYAYTPPGASAYPLLVSELAEAVEGLEFTTVAPGGFGDLACLLRVREPRLPRPELGLFSRVVLKDGLFTCFSGEWSDPALVLDSASGDHVLLSALGGGASLRDDPDESAYVTQTAATIVAAEFSKRAAYLAVDADQSAVLPAPSPAATFSPLYDGYHLEEILHDLCFDLGDYTWTVYDHPTNRDSAGFATWQLQMHPRDIATTHYIALGEDVLSWHVAPSSQRAYNAVEVCYVDTSGGPGKVLVTDPRLAVGGGQGTAPFRRRKLRRSLGRAPLTAAQATTIANAWLAGYQDVTNKVEVQLRGVRDFASGKPIPLHQLRADRNLFIPELAVRGQRLSSGPVPGTNQFYIVETLYRESSRGEIVCRLQLDNYADAGAVEIARLKLAYDAAQRARGTFRQPISPGTPVVGGCGGTFSSAAAGGTNSVWVHFPGQMPSTPVVTLSITGSSNASGISATGATRYGFSLQWTSPAAGATSVIGTYLAQV